MEKLGSILDISFLGVGVDIYMPSEFPFFLTTGFC